MKSCVELHAVYDWKDSYIQLVSNQDRKVSRLALNLLSYRGSLDPNWKSLQTENCHHTPWRCSNVPKPVVNGGIFHCYMLDKSICNFRSVESMLLLLLYF